MRDIDIGLCTPQRPKISTDIVQLNATRHHRRNHEGGVDDFAKAKLFHEVILRTEHGGGRRAAVQQLIGAIRR